MGAGSTSGASLAQNGERLFASLGCNCLPLGRRRRARGPNLASLRLPAAADGRLTCHANDAFLRETILNPSTHVTAGYAPIMPTYQGQISEEGLIDLVEYIKNLNSNYRIQQTLTASQLPAGQAARPVWLSSPPWNTAPRRQLGAGQVAREVGQDGTGVPGR